jgi:hypothetical protein
MHKDTRFHPRPFGRGTAPMPCTDQSVCRMSLRVLSMGRNTHPSSGHCVTQGLIGGPLFGAPREWLIVLREFVQWCG